MEKIIQIKEIRALPQEICCYFNVKFKSVWELRLRIGELFMVLTNLFDHYLRLISNNSLP